MGHMEGMCGTQDGDRAMQRGRGGFTRLLGRSAQVGGASEVLENFPLYHKNCERQQKRRRR